MSNFDGTRFLRKEGNQNPLLKIKKMLRKMNENKTCKNFLNSFLKFLVCEGEYNLDNKNSHFSSF